MGNFLIVKFLAEVGGYVFGNLGFVPPADRLIEDDRIRFAIILIDHVRGVFHNDAVTVAFPIELDLCRLLLGDVNEDALVDFCAVRVFHEPGDEVDPDGLLVIEAAAAVFDVYRRIRFGGSMNAVTIAPRSAGATALSVPLYAVRSVPSIWKKLSLAQAGKAVSR